MSKGLLQLVIDEKMFGQVSWTLFWYNTYSIYSQFTIDIRELDVSPMQDQSLPKINQTDPHFGSWGCGVQGTPQDLLRADQVHWTWAHRCRIGGAPYRIEQSNQVLLVDRPQVRYFQCLNAFTLTIHWQASNHRPCGTSLSSNTNATPQPRNHAWVDTGTRCHRKKYVI